MRWRSRPPFNALAPGLARSPPEIAKVRPGMTSRRRYSGLVQAKNRRLSPYHVESMHEMVGIDAAITTEVAAADRLQNLPQPSSAGTGCDAWVLVVGARGL